MFVDLLEGNFKRWQILCHHASPQTIKKFDVRKVVTMGDMKNSSGNKLQFTNLRLRSRLPSGLLAIGTSRYMKFCLKCGRVTIFKM